MNDIYELDVLIEKKRRRTNPAFLKKRKFSMKNSRKSQELDQFTKLPE